MKQECEKEKLRCLFKKKWNALESTDRYAKYELLNKNPIDLVWVRRFSKVGKIIQSRFLHADCFKFLLHI